MAESLRLTEILTTSSAVANFMGAREVSPGHVLSAIAILLGEKSLDDLGRPQSPMLSRATGAGSGAEPAVRELAQRWFARLGGDALGELDETALTEFRSELRALESEVAG